MRSKKTPKKIIQYDPVYNNALVAKFINCSMLDGKKSIASSHVYAALDEIATKTGVDAIEYLLEAVENVKPTIEVRSRRIGGAGYQVPTPIRPERRDSLAVRWIITAARNRANLPYKTFSAKLAAELMEAHESAGSAMKKKLDTHKMAEANKAFAHFRW
jgi:small subunit ribosomal protein S7